MGGTHLLLSNYLARSACMPKGLYVLLALILFRFIFLFNDSLKIYYLRIKWTNIYDFLTIGRYLIVVLRSGLFSNRSRDVAMATNFRPKFAKDLNSACWHSEIAMPICAMEGAMIRLHHIEIWYTSVQPRRSRGSFAYPHEENN